MMPSISMKEAVQTAKTTLNDLFSDDAPKALGLEEIELVEISGRDYWAVTLGFHRTKSIKVHVNSMNDFFKPAPQIENRVYKTLFVDANSGEFFKMEIRLVQ
ncbi:MAG: hypothetical protein K2Y28_06145 [Burkholderiaceae bacterium]|nr:hypothetical protein [Burkholderiaceae bacterium]